MSIHRFDHKVDRKVKTETSRLQRVEVITGVERRRDWTDEEKLTIIAESCRDGVVISDVARHHGLRPQQLFTWRNEFRKRNAGGFLGLTPAAGGNAVEPAFAPVMITDGRSAEAQVETATPTAVPSFIEILLGDVTVRLHGGVDGKALSTALRAVRAAT